MKLIETEVWATPGEHSIIDTINPETGLTSVYGKTAEQVLAEDPQAVRMTWGAWVQARSKEQRTAITWLRCDADRYDEMLNVLPPALLWTGGAFLVGEPADHDVLSGQPRFDAFWHIGESYWHSSRPITRDELKEAMAKRVGQADALKP